MKNEVRDGVRGHTQVIVPGSRVALAGIREMMRFIENEQCKPLAPSLEKRKRRVVRRYRERADFLLVAVVGPDAFSAECVGELREPLGHERSRRRDDARAGPELIDGEQCDERLSGAGR